MYGVMKFILENLVILFVFRYFLRMFSETYICALVYIFSLFVFRSI